MAMTLTSFSSVVRRSDRGQAPIHRVPIDVGKERFHILRALGGFEIEQISVLPYVHDQNRLEPGDVPHLVKGDPVVGETPRLWIFVGNGPTHSPHLADADE